MILLFLLTVVFIAVGMMAFLLKLLKKPIQWFLKFLIHVIFGYVFLWIFNFAGAWFGLSLSLNVFTCAFAGIFGIPGVIVMLILKILAII